MKEFLIDPKIVAAAAAWGSLFVGIAAFAALIAGFYQIRKQIQKTNLSTWVTTFRTEYAEFIIKSGTVINEPDAPSWEFEKLGLMIKLSLNRSNRVQRELYEAIESFVGAVLFRKVSAPFATIEDQVIALHNLAEAAIQDAQKRI